MSKAEKMGNPVRKVLSFKDEKQPPEVSLPPAMREPVFAAPTPSCHWLRSSWTDIKDEVVHLIASVDVTLGSRVLAADEYCFMFERKKALETAIRRRCRIVDEIWRCFKSLEEAHKDLLEGNLNVNSNGSGQTPSRFSLADPDTHNIVVGVRSIANCDGDVPAPLDAFPQEVRSCLEILSSTLIRCGVELELYDEESRGINRIAGIGLGLAFFVAICTVVYYY